MAELNEVLVPQGIFVDSLTRNNSKIKGDRADAIKEDAELTYRRKVEDIGVLLRKLIRDRKNMLDMSPENTMTLKVATDFDGEAFAAKDLELGIKIRQAEIELDLAAARCNELFGTK